MANLSTILSEGLVVPLRGYLSGLVLSTAGSSATFSVAAGMAVDDGQKEYMNLSSAISKTTSAWAVGSGNGGLDTGSVAINTWYHVYLIKRPDTGVVDVLFSLSASSPTMPTNYTLSRRIGAMRTNGSSQWTLFSQFGDEFLWDSKILDGSIANPGTTGVLRTLTVPTGVRIQAIIGITGQTSGTNQDGRVYVSSPDVSDVATGSANFNAGFFNPSASSVGDSISQLLVRTNTSAQIRTRNSGSDASTTLIINTAGWIDTRGKLS